MRIKRDPLDKLFSDYIRQRDGWTCQRCSRLYTPPTSGLHAAHMFGRRVKATRWRPTNAMALCYGCHSYADTNQTVKEDLFKKKFGEDIFKTNRALHDLRTRSKVDREATKMELTALLAGLGNK